MVRLYLLETFTALQKMEARARQTKNLQNGGKGKNLQMYEATVTTKKCYVHKSCYYFF